MAKRDMPPWLQWLRSRAFVAAMTAPRILPYHARLATIAGLMAWVIGPLAGHPKRIRANLLHVLPDLPEAEIARLTRAVPANTGRMLTEIAAGRPFTQAVRQSPVTGPGLAALDAAREAHRPILVISGHFGNFDAARLALVQRGHKVGALYRPADDPYLDAQFTSLISGIAEPIFPRGRKGLGQMLRFLRAGNVVAILIDQYVNRGAPLTFFGQTAPTSTAAAEMALKYDALIVPVYGIRRGARFEIIAEDPVPPSDPETMTQALNDSLEARVRADMDQWLWVHRRWKPERQARQRARAAAKTAP